jgi:hypothetical protein
MQIFYGWISAALRLAGCSLHSFRGFYGQSITTQHIEPPMFARGAGSIGVPSIAAIWAAG